MEDPESKGEESLFHDLELRYISLRTEYESVCSERNILEAKNKALDETISIMRGATDSSSSEASRHGMELKQRDAKVRELEQAAEKLGDQYSRKCEESDRLRDDVKMQADQLVSCQSRMRELQTALSEAESQLLPAQYSMAKLERQQASQEEHVSWLETELASKTAQMGDVRGELMRQNEELVAQLALANSESSARADQVARLNDKATLNEEKSLELVRRTQELEEQGVLQREELLAELQASKRLADLYNKHFDEATAKVSELEELTAVLQQRLSQQQEQFQSKLSSQVKLAEEVLHQSEEAAKNTVSQLEQELAMMRGKEETLQQQVDAQGRRSLDCNAGRHDLMELRDSLALPTGLSAADMLDKAVTAEKVAAEETRKRKECELYLEKILKDIESKAPLIASQRRDYKRVLESHSQLSKRVDDLVNDCSGLRKQLAEAEKARKLAVMDASSLESQSQDLARQLQHLLKKSMGLSGVTGPDERKTGTDAGAVISDHLVTYDDVDELQVRNMQLLKVVRKLSGEQEGALVTKESPHLVMADEGAMSVDTFADMEEALKAAVAELAGMRESRQRMEEMVASLVQQRDIYRTMLEEMDATSGGKQGTTLASPTYMVQETRGEGGLEQPNAGPAGSALEGEAAELRRDLDKYKDEVRMLKERNSRLELAEAALNEAVDKGRNELATLRAQLATSNSDAKFQSHRVSSLESALANSRQNEESLGRRRSEAESLLMSQQKEARQTQEVLLQLRESLRLAEEKARHSDISAEVGRAAENRLQSQVKELRDEMSRQSALTESMGRIEASLASRMQEEREGLQREVQSLTQAMERNRKDFSETVMIGEQKVQTLEDELRLCRAEKERKAEEAAVLREDLARQQGTCAAAQERSGVLERQLTIAQDRLAAVQGVSTTDSLLATENEQKDAELERAYREVADLKMQLESSETHVTQFRTISNSTEAMLRELQKRSADSRTELEEDLANVQKELTFVRKELSERKDQLKQAIEESESTREAMQSAVRQLEDDLKAARHAQEVAEAAAKQAEAQAEALRCDAVRSQEDAKEATSNYERELAFHAKAAADLRATEGRLVATQQDLELSQHKTAELSAQCLEHELRRQEQEAAGTKALNSLKEDVAAQRHTNDLLHSQVQSMSVQLSRMANQNSKVEDVEGGDDTMLTDDEGVRDEVGDLRKSSFELREVIRYMKREKDMSEARMTLAETEKHRFSAQLSSVQKALDEARAELQRELESKSLPTRSEDEFSKLMSEITQLNVVRESNAHLRFEHEQVSRERDELVAKLQSALDDAAPVKEKVCRLESQREALEADKAAAEVDAGYWKERLHQLVSRYSDVDPEEHRVLQEKLASTEAELVETKGQLVECQAQLEQASSEREAVTQELTGVRATADRLDKTNENFRGKLRELASQKKDLIQQNTNLKNNLKVQTLKAAKAEAQSVANLKKKVAVKEAALPLTLTASDNIEQEQGPAKVVERAATVSKSVDAPVTMPDKSTPSTQITTPTPAAPVVSDKQKNLELLRSKLMEKKLGKATATSVEPSTTVPPPAQPVASIPQSGVSDIAATNEDCKSTKRKSEDSGDIVLQSERDMGLDRKEAAPPPATKRPRVAAACSFFLSPTGCRHGENCRFLHAAPTPPTPPSAPIASASVEDVKAPSLSAPPVADEKRADSLDVMEVEEEQEMQAPPKDDEQLLPLDQQRQQFEIAAKTVVQSDGENVEDPAALSILPLEQPTGSTERGGETGGSKSLDPDAQEFTPMEEQEQDKPLRQPLAAQSMVTDSGADDGKLEDAVSKSDQQSEVANQTDVVQQTGVVSGVVEEDVEVAESGVTSSAAGGLRPWPTKPQVPAQQKSSPFATKPPTGTFFLGKQPVKSQGGFSFTTSIATGKEVTVEGDLTAKSTSVPQLFSLPPASADTTSSSSPSFSLASSLSSAKAKPDVNSTPFRSAILQPQHDATAIGKEGVLSTPSTSAVGKPPMTPEEKRQARMQRFTQSRNKLPLPVAIEETSEKEQQEMDDSMEKGNAELTKNNDDGEDDENNDV